MARKSDRYKKNRRRIVSDSIRSEDKATERDAKIEKIIIHVIILLFIIFLVIAFVALGSIMYEKVHL